MIGIGGELTPTWPNIASENNNIGLSEFLGFIWIHWKILHLAIRSHCHL